MSVDLSEFRELGKPRRTECSMKRLDVGGESDALHAALTDESIPHSAIVLWLRRRNVDVKAHTVGRHRNGQCSCDG